MKVSDYKNVHMYAAKLMADQGFELSVEDALDKIKNNRVPDNLVPLYEKTNQFLTTAFEDLTDEQDSVLAHAAGLDKD